MMLPSTKEKQMSAASFTDRLAEADYLAGYDAGVGLGRARFGGCDRECYERGLEAGRVALWFGVALAV